MRYDLLAQQALRGVVRAALERVARDGLPGEHHFYVAFSTRAPGVQISHRLRERYAEEMTIVLQHQFFGLEVGPERFSVQLHFNNIPETLVVPFSALKGFYDPSVQFGLQFDASAQAAEATRKRGKASPHQKAANSQARGRAADGEPRLAAPSDEATPAADSAAAGSSAAGNATAGGATAGSATGGGAQVVSIDQFRKK